MRTGQLRKRIRIQTLTRTQSATTGQLSDSWAEPGRRMWANVRPNSAREFAEAQSTESDISHTITIRYQTPIPSPEDRILLGTRVFHIAAPAINMGERNQWLVFKCIERTPE